MLCDTYVRNPRGLSINYSDNAWKRRASEGVAASLGLKYLLTAVMSNIFLPGEDKTGLTAEQPVSDVSFHNKRVQEPVCFLLAPDSTHVLHHTHSSVSNVPVSDVSV